MIDNFVGGEANRGELGDGLESDASSIGMFGEKCIGLRLIPEKDLAIRWAAQAEKCGPIPANEELGMLRPGGLQALSETGIVFGAQWTRGASIADVAHEGALDDLNAYGRFRPVWKGADVFPETEDGRRAGGKRRGVGEWIAGCEKDESDQG